MQIILVRHAVAEDREEFAKKSKEDHLRPLSLKGRRKLEKAAQHLHDWVESIDLIVTSPYVRARQTAEILSQIFFDTKVVEAPELVPQSPPSAFIKWLKAHGRNLKTVLVVGHEPHLSSLISLLMAGVDHQIVEMKKSGMASLEIDRFEDLSPGSARLNWLIQPRLIVD